MQTIRPVSTGSVFVFERAVDVLCRKAAASAQQLFQTRLRSEEEARSSRPTKNRLVSSSLAELFEERKFASTEKELAELAKKYGMDLDKLERLARHVNSVSVNQDTVRRTVNEDGVENVTMMVSAAVLVMVIDETLASCAGLLGEPKNRETGVGFRSLRRPPLAVQSENRLLQYI